MNTLTCTDADAADIAVGMFFRLMVPTGFSGTGTAKEDQLFTITGLSSAFGFTNVDFTPDALQPIVLGDQLNAYSYADAGDYPLVYWPCEEEREATVIGSGLLGGGPLAFRVDTPEFGAFDSFLGSAPILKLNNAELYADVPDYDDTNQAFTLHFLLHMPAADEAATGTDIVQFYTTGTAENWEIQYAAGGGGGDLVVRANDTTTGTNLFSHAYDLDMRGEARMVTLAVEQTGPSTVQYTITSANFSATGSLAGGSSPNTATATSVTTLGKITSIRINPAGGFVDVGFGHLGIVPNAYFWLAFVDLPGGRQGESLPRRFIRLGYEEDVPVTYCQGVEAAPDLGPQLVDTLLENWNKAAELDMGRFYESRGAYSFEYRTRISLENQTPVLELDYEGGAVLADFVPTRDDQATRNDVTVKREGGSTARAVLETGPKSVESAGRYTDSPTILARRDEDLPGQAAWRLHLGTVAEDRYPTIKLTSANGTIPVPALLSVGVGSRVVVTNASARRRYEDISQLVSGYTLTLDPYVPTLEINGTPSLRIGWRCWTTPTLPAGQRLDRHQRGLDTTETGIHIASTDGVTDWINSTDDAANSRSIS